MPHLLQMLTFATLALSWSTDAATSKDAPTWYPKYHVAPKQGWMNDPNGLIYYDGYYHVFWQYNPDYSSWGLMHWGHARSTDMLTWEHLPIALTPSLPEDINGIYSGSAVVKDDNLTVIYTGVSENSSRQRQMAATSSDGLNFEKLGVIIVRDGDETDFRDPKAWHQDDSWFVVIGSKTSDQKGEVLLYRSDDFFKWSYEGVLAQADDKLGYMWECPDFFTLRDKHILVINPQGIQQNGYDYQNLYQTGYFVGSWTPGGNYTIEKGFREIDHGHDFYASQTFLAEDGRRIMIGWLDMWQSPFPENSTGWAGMFTLPRELTLSETGDLEVRPIREIRDARKVRNGSDKPFSLDGDGVTSLIDDAIYSSEILIEFNLTKTISDIFGVEFRSSNDSSLEGMRIFVNTSESRLFVERYYPEYNVQFSSRSVAVDLTLSTLLLDIFVDSSSLEVFVNDGQAVLSNRIYPNDNQRSLYFFVKNGSLGVDSYFIWDIDILL